jgi:threonine synthase
MKLYSTNNKEYIVDLKEAVLKGLPEDNGLFMPINIPELPQDFIQNLKNFSFQEIAFKICTTLFENYIPENDLKKIVNEAITFPAPVVKLNDNKYVLELFHGPSLAFKDFGARFMAKLMGYFNENEEEDLVILVATSGDTGGAVAAGFHKTPGIKVVILYPSGKVSNLQEKQLTTLGENITALEVKGTFDDCQALVKKAFLDQPLNNKIRLSSANSINIARLIPQSFYYFEAAKQVDYLNRDLVFCVPSGNFGNLTAGLFAQKMGLPIKHFIAATNINDIVPSYLSSGIYTPKPSIATISNAMDVGNPSNFARMLDLFSLNQKEKCSTWNIMKRNISGFYYDDVETRYGITHVFDQFNYTIDPHGAVGYLALERYQAENPGKIGVVLETAHPSKFKKVVEEEIKQKVNIPERLAVLANKPKESTLLNVDYQQFKQFLIDNF